MIGKKIIRLNEVDSTNNYAKGLIIHKESGEGTVVLAYSQERGRGNANNSWESEPGKNLTFSIILHPFFIEPEKQFAISMVAALGIFYFINPLTKDVSIKWPNDIYVGEKKIGGLLIENMISGNDIYESVVGVGLNLNQETFPEMLINPVSLKLLTKIDYDIENCLMHLCLSIEKQYDRLKEKGIDNLFLEYSQRLYKKGIWADYIANGEKFSGCISGVDEIGQLLVEDKTGQLLTFQFKEIEFVLNGNTEEKERG